MYLRRSRTPTACFLQGAASIWLSCRGRSVASPSSGRNQRINVQRVVLWVRFTRERPATIRLARPGREQGEARRLGNTRGWHCLPKAHHAPRFKAGIRHRSRSPRRAKEPASTGVRNREPAITSGRTGTGRRRARRAPPGRARRASASLPGRQGRPDCPEEASRTPRPCCPAVGWSRSSGV